MKKTLYIHIGTGKTGTTMIQECTKLNLDTFNNKHNFNYYPSHFYSNNYKNPDRSNLDRVDLTNKLLEELKNNINSSNLNSFLISSEFFPGEKHEEIQHIKNIFSNICDIKIIVYLRRQDEFIWSWYSQVIKTTNVNYCLDNCINRLRKAEYILDYEKFLEPWAKVFGTENILVNTFPPKENLIINFFKNLDIELDLNDFKSIDRANLSLKAEQIVFIKSLLPKLDLEYASTIVKIIQKPFDIDFNYTKSLIPPAQRKEILNDFDKFNDNVAKKYLNRDKLFDELSIDDEETWEYPDIIKNGYYDLATKYIQEKHEIHIN